MAIKTNAKQLEGYLETYRDGDQAMLRLMQDRAQPGDGFLMAKADIDPDAMPTAERDRLRSVSSLLERIGTDDEYRDARDAYNAAEPVNAETVRECDERIQALQAQIDGLDATKRAALDDTATKHRQFQSMHDPRQRLQSEALMPKCIQLEIRAQRNALRNRPRENELAELIAGLRADGARLSKSVSNDPRLGRRVLNENLLEAYVSRAQEDASHRGHAFWRDRVYSESEWENFNTWANARADEYQGELDRLRARAESDLAETCEGLLSFYVADVD